MLALFAAAALAAAPAAVEVTAPGPSGALAGTLVDPGPAAPALLIIPGSGPTDRDGNNPLGVAGASYRLLADALAARGVATLRIDKRGLFGSKAAAVDPNAVTLQDYAADAHAWIDWWRARSGRRCVWIAGHSEGGLVAVLAAQRPAGVCGVVLLDSPGRPLNVILREQFARAPEGSPGRDAALAVLDAIAAGRTVDPATLPPGVSFPLTIQRYLLAAAAVDPARLIATVRQPVLIVTGTRDRQVPATDAALLKAAASAATLTAVPGMTHVLKIAADDSPAANRASYTDPSLPIAPGVVDAIATFVTAPR